MKDTTKGIFTLLISLLFIPYILSQVPFEFERRAADMHSISGEITIDGALDDEAWNQLTPITGFYQQNPIDDTLASVHTTVKIGYDINGIYIGASMEDPGGQVIPTLKRDLLGNSDAFVVVIDPNNQKTNAFAFGVNAGGAQTEILLSDQNGDASWDNRWKSGAKMYIDHWEVEIFIPFKTLRFDKNNDEWGMNFVRFDAEMNQAHVWSPVPRQFDPGDMGYLGLIKWDNFPDAKRSNIALIPYTTVSTSKSFDPDNTTNKSDIGGDAKISLTTNLNLDLTVNPDFSQVEVDRQVSNLTRFNIFFPERRQFFLENADLFSNYGQFANQPFYSRRIGLDPNGNTVPILYGARLTGNVTDKLRIGALNMHTRTTDVAPGQNFYSLATNYRIGARSTIKGLFLNRQAYNGSESVDGDYGRNLGGELNLSTGDGKLSGQLGMIQSYKRGSVRAINMYVVDLIIQENNLERLYLYKT